MAEALVSLRGDGPWRGRSTRQVSDRGASFQLRIVNGYVSSDGNHVFNVPGFRTLVDLTVVNNSDGYRRQAYDSILPTAVYHSPAVGGQYVNYAGDAASPEKMLTLKCEANEEHIHGFEQVRGTLVLFGESLYRKIPIYDATRTQLTITHVELPSPNLHWNLTLSGSPNIGYTASDVSTGQHGLEDDDIVTLEDVTNTMASPAITQANLDSLLNNRFHPVLSRASNKVVLTTQHGSLASPISNQTVTGNIFRVKNNASGTYATPNPPSPWEPNIYTRVDDPAALTTWTVRESLTLSSPSSTKCQPSWVANRQRDHGDGNAPNFDWAGGMADPVPWFDGLALPGQAVYNAQRVATPGDGGTRAWSRRRQKELPYRLNPEPAGDRIILAAPGYMCCFQIPLMIPLEPEAWPSPPGDWSTPSGAGVRWAGNDIYDKPRCLGVPKAVLLDSLRTESLSPVGNVSPPGELASPGNYPHHFWQYPSWSPSEGLSAGTYKIAVSYVDEATGEEGLASEPVTVVLSDNFLVDLRMMVFHPGYIMSESLCLRLNVYVAPPGSEALGFYTSLPLSGESLVDSTALVYASAKYGLGYGGVSPKEGRLYTVIHLPRVASPFTDNIDFTRLAPASGLMPRGAESAKMIRGQLFTVGHSGTHGNAKELLRSLMTANYSATGFGIGCMSPDEVQVRGHRSEMIPLSTPVSPQGASYPDGPFGIAGSLFPSAYQGMEFFSNDLLRLPYNRFIVDIVKNNAVGQTASQPDHGLNAADPEQTRDRSFEQRLRTRHAIRDHEIADPSERYGREVYGILPRGQIQIGDPGRPGAVNAAGIQFLDAKKDDDGIAIGQIGGAAVICSTRETHLLQWGRTPRGTVPSVLSLEHGCVATNSMVNGDGVLAWIGDRGPVAMAGGPPQWVSEQLSEDFFGDNARYAVDSKGLMRHCWGAHDAARGLILWGLVTSDSTHEVSYKGTSATFANHSDEARSRFPCNEILIWSYRANAFSTWVPPSGLEVLWMRPLKLGDGSTRMCFLAADKRIYAWDEEWSDTNENSISVTPNTRTTGSTTLDIDETLYSDTTSGSGGTGRAGGTLVRDGMTVAFLDADSEIVSTTTVSSFDAGGSTPKRITLAASSVWDIGDTVEVGYRPTLTIEGTYLGRTTDTMRCSGLHMRYHLIGDGKAHCKVTATTAAIDSSSPQEPGMTESPQWHPLVKGTETTAQFNRIGQRRIFEEGKPEGAEISFKVEILGRAGIGIADVVAEVSA